MKQLLLLSLILLSACAVKETPTVTPKIRSDCQEAWIYAPESLIIELNAGKQVLANPSVHEFPLFCSQTEAQKALQAEISQKKLPPEGWAYFRLAGEFKNLVTFADQKAILKEQASLVDFEK